MYRILNVHLECIGERLGGLSQGMSLVYSVFNATSSDLRTYRIWRNLRRTLPLKGPESRAQAWELRDRITNKLLGYLIWEQGEEDV